MIHISSNGYLNATPQAGKPLIGYRSILSASNVSADSDPDETPVINIVTEQTSQFWKSGILDEQSIYFNNSDNAIVNYLGVAKHNFWSGNISYQLQGNNDVPWAIEDAVFEAEFNDGRTHRAIFISPDGVNVYATDTVTDEIVQHILSTPWDISTATLHGVFDVSAQTTSPTGFFMKPDGTSMYVTNTTTGFIFQYTLSTPGDVTTAVYASLSFGTGLGNNRNIFIKPDGTKLYITTDSVGATEQIRQYTLSTPWNISTATYDSVFLSTAAETTTPFGCFFHPTGNYCYTVGSNNVFEYRMTTAWDLSTATYSSNSFDVSAQETGANSVWFDSEGLAFYIGGTNTGDIHQYRMAQAWEDVTADAVPTSDGAIMAHFDNSSFTVYRLYLIPDSTLPQIAHIKLGEVLVMERCIKAPHKPINLSRSSKVISNQSENGSFLGKVLVNQYLETQYEFKNITPTFYRAYVDEFSIHAVTGAFFIAWKPLSYPNDVAFGWTSADISFSADNDNGIGTVSFAVKAVA